MLVRRCAALLACVLPPGLFAQALPVPNGPWIVARQAFGWTDRDRPDPYAPSQRRELMIYLWYPTRARSGAPAPYVPNAADISQNPSAQNAARNVYAKVWPDIVAGTLVTHAFEDAPPAPGRFPLILFSPGDSATSFSYTGQIEDLVTHGFIVAAVEHTGMSGLVRFPDGHIRLHAQLPTPSATNHNDPLQQMIATAEAGTEIAAEDLIFVLDVLAKLPLPLAQHIDLSRVAAVGHSAGGTVSARACQLDSRLRACVTEEGEVNPVGAFFDYRDHTSIEQPLLLIQISQQPSDQDLSRMHETRVQWNGYLRHERDQLGRCGPDSAFAQVERRGFNHASFSDGPLLNANNTQERAQALANLHVADQLVRAFLDRSLRGKHVPLLRKPVPSGVSVEPVGH